jgi:hypothetical protein
MFATIGLPAISFGQAKPLTGSTAVMGTPGRIGPYQFTLTGARFATRIVHRGDTAVAHKDKKFLVLNYTVQNPGKEDLAYDYRGGCSSPRTARLLLELIPPSVLVFDVGVARRA